MPCRVRQHEQRLVRLVLAQRALPFVRDAQADDVEAVATGLVRRLPPGLDVEPADGRQPAGDAALLDLAGHLHVAFHLHERQQPLPHPLVGAREAVQLADRALDHGDGRLQIAATHPVAVGDEGLDGLAHPSGLQDGSEHHTGEHRQRDRGDPQAHGHHAPDQIPLRDEHSDPEGALVGQRQLSRVTPPPGAIASKAPRAGPFPGVQTPERRRCLVPVQRVERLKHGRPAGFVVEESRIGGQADHAVLVIRHEHHAVLADPRPGRERGDVTERDVEADHPTQTIGVIPGD
ncbi:MAG: hypothetical protein ACYTGC_10720, partial [Planctomycetota bacterium]